MNRVKITLVAAISIALVFIFSSCAGSKPAETLVPTTSFEEVTGFKNKLTWLKSYAQSGGSYVIELNANESVGGTCGGLFTYCFDLSYKNKDNITITLRGIGAERIITKGEPGKIFSVGSGVTLILEENITLKGPSAVGALEHAKSDALVDVNSGGTLIMNEGSTITGGMNISCTLSQSGGVNVSSGGTFIMKGGLITRNTTFPVPDPAMVAASKGKYNALGKKECKGGGVYVSGGGSIFGKVIPSGTFIKTGGTITGNSSDAENGNVVKDFGGTKAISGFGHAIYFSVTESNLRSIDTTVGPEVSLHFSDGKFSEVPVSVPTTPVVPESTDPAPVPVDEPAEKTLDSD
jgi:hypothetical protein